MSTFVHLRVDTDSDGICRIVLDRPERLNAVNPQMAEELPQAVASAAADDAVRVVVITGAGRGFCSGLDLSEPPRLPDATLVQRLDPLGWVGRWVLALQSCEKPVVAAVNGAAAGAGFGLALAADIRLVAQSASLTAGYVRRGLSPDAGVSWLLPRLIGSSRATEILLSGRDITAQEALDTGLAAGVFPDAEFEEAVSTYAKRLAGGPPIAFALTKRLLASSYDLPLADQLKRELELIKVCFSSRDVSEALRAFAEKRHPVFHGR